MSIQQEITKTSNNIKIVLSNWKYKVISLVSGISFFATLYYFMVSTVANNDIWISVMMSGPLFITWNIANMIALSALSGILLSMIIFKFRLYSKVTGKGIFGLIGSSIGAFGVGCPTCGAFLFGLIGMPLVLMYLPFKGLELQTLGILILFISIYFTGKSINGSCKI